MGVFFIILIVIILIFVIRTIVIHKKKNKYGVVRGGQGLWESAKDACCIHK